MSVEIYIETTYLYILASMIIIAIIVLFLDDYNFNVSPMVILISFFVSLLTLFSLLLIPSYYRLIKHFIFLCFLTTLAILLLDVYRIANYANVLTKTLITIIIIISAIIFLVNTYGLAFIDSWIPYVGFSLFILIIIQLLDLLLGHTSGMDQRFTIYSTIAVIIFTLFLIYDIRKIKNDGEIIIKNCYPVDNCVDYPKSSISVILDLTNLFTNLVNIYK